MSLDRPAAARLLLRRAAPPAPDGTIVDVTVDSAGWEFADIAVFRLRPGQSVAREADDRERLVLVLEGHAEVRLGDLDFGTLGTRDVGVRRPAGAGRPRRARVDRATSSPRPTRSSSSPRRPGGPVRVTRQIAAGDVLVEARGSGQTARRIHHLLPPDAEAGRLIAYEVFTPGGNWSSYPPHKHDTEDPPVESRLEEIYFYRFARPEGFAFQRVYTPDRSLDESLAPGDGDVVLVPRGYHPVGVPAGYDCYYLNIMAGPTRAWHFTIDPDHAWLMDWNPAAPLAAQEEASV